MYQQIKNYKGSMYGEPTYNGIEYDYEVPDNMVVSSPGGLSSTHHHYTKGIYSTASSRWDIYGGEGNRYPYGEFGNLYQTGHNAPQYMGQYAPAPDAMFTQNESIPQKDNFSKVDITPIGKADSEAVVEISPESKKSRLNLTNPLLFIVLFIILYIALDYWSKSSEMFITEYIHKTKKLSWGWLLVYASIFTLLVILLANVTNIPLVTLEQI